ncbi:TAP-like protein-domain-containing protein [Exophiala viscosa]|uniref:TAP-like protein-domain-containing protein n=1 Tax=Exophiala viscosa TaxID=2486360 RepID=UPI0021957F61|nr:TAP-like protein-domain-containing protein [Exophiala viscosa]
MVLGNSSDVALGHNFASAQSESNDCLQRAGDTVQLVGTAFVARDMARIVDALEEDGMLRYWGLSYGTVLGATFSAMFPEKVDKVLLDGNANVQQYYAGWETQMYVDLDGTVQGFFDGCVASPDICPLAGDGETAEDVYNTVEALFTQLKYNPIAVTILNETTIVTYNDVKFFMFGNLYEPASWPTIATLLSYLVDDNPGLYVETMIQLTGNATAGNFTDGFAAIKCGDSAYRADSLADFIPFEEEIVPTSTWGGLDFGLNNMIICSSWLMNAKEVYSGDWNVETKNPLMLIGNTWDPVTPLVAAQANSALFPGSVVLQHNGYGHCSLAQPSLCTAEAIQAYFVNGTLPASGTVCQPDVPLFSNATWEDALDSISLDGTVPVKAKRDVPYGPSSEDLLEALIELSRDVPGKPVTLRSGRI